MPQKQAPGGLMRPSSSSSRAGLQQGAAGDKHVFKAPARSSELGLDRLAAEKRKERLASGEGSGGSSSGRDSKRSRYDSGPDEDSADSDTGVAFKSEPGLYWTIDFPPSAHIRSTSRQCRRGLPHRRPTHGKGQTKRRLTVAVSPRRPDSVSRNTARASWPVQQAAGTGSRMQLSPTPGTSGKRASKGRQLCRTSGTASTGNKPTPRLARDLTAEITTEIVTETGGALALAAIPTGHHTRAAETKGEGANRHGRHGRDTRRRRHRLRASHREHGTRRHRRVIVTVSHQLAKCGMRRPRVRPAVVPAQPRAERASGIRLVGRTIRAQTTPKSSRQ